MMLLSACNAFHRRDTRFCDCSRPAKGSGHSRLGAGGVTHFGLSASSTTSSAEVDPLKRTDCWNGRKSWQGYQEIVVCYSCFAYVCAARCTVRLVAYSLAFAIRTCVM